MKATSARELSERYSVTLLDAYGVLVEGEGVIEGAAEFISDLNERGTRYFVLTNDASKLPATSSAKYAKAGLEIPEDRIITSGSLLDRYFAEEGLEGAGCIVMGPEDSEAYVAHAGGRVLPIDESDASKVDVVVIGDESGYPFLETLDRVMSLIMRKLDAGQRVRLVCPNPDLVFPRRPGEWGLASGSIARVIEEALALRYPTHIHHQFDRLGKPHPAIFVEAVRRAGTRDVVMIGDQLQTDIRGALCEDLAAALVTWGLTGELPKDLPDELSPTHLVDRF